MDGLQSIAPPPPKNTQNKPERIAPRPSVEKKVYMNAIGEQALQWFSAERASAEPTETAGPTDIAEPDLTALVRDYSGLLYRVALSVLRNPAEAEDVVQDAFLHVLQRRHSLGAVIDIRPWLVRIAWNLALDRVRRTRPSQLDDLFAAGPVYSPPRCRSRYGVSALNGRAACGEPRAHHLQRRHSARREESWS